MSKTFKIIIGVAIGVFASITLCVGALFYLFFHKNDPSNPENWQYFDVTTSKGTVSLHTYMPKDSVIMLLGNPKSYSSNVYGNIVTENIRYEFRHNGAYNNIYIDLRNGHLQNVSQNSNGGYATFPDTVPYGAADTVPM